jgi:hypothetical protein
MTQMDEVGKRNKYAPTIEKVSLSGLLFADYLAIGAFTIQGLQKGIDAVVVCGSRWNLKCNLEKPKIMVFKRGGKLQKQKSWHMFGKQLSVVTAFSYVDIILDKLGGGGGGTTWGTSK